jgi:hypothetical protein
MPYIAWSDTDNLPFEERAYEGIFSTIITLQTEVNTTNFSVSNYGSFTQSAHVPVGIRTIQSTNLRNFVRLQERKYHLYRQTGATTTDEEQGTTLY